MKEKIFLSGLMNQTGRINNNWKRILIKHKELYDEIIHRTSFLANDATFVERLYVIYCDLTEIPLCKTCGNKVKFENTKKKYHIYCSSKCSANSLETQKKRNDKRDMEEIIRKTKNTWRQKTLKEMEHIKTKTKNTINKKYENGSIWNNPSTREKRKQTNIKRYGVEHVSQNQNIKDKISQNHARKLDLNVSDLKELNNTGFTLSEISEQLGVSKHAVWTRFRDNNIQVLSHFKSKQEDYIENILKETNIDYISRNKSIIHPHELDFFIPDKSLAIEVNGVFWHSELNGKNKKYHINKTQNCLSKNIELLHFFDTEIINRSDIVRSIILYKLGLSCNKIYARKCIIKEIDSQTCKEFCDLNHLHKGIYGSINVGLFHNNKLISVLCASKNRFGKTNDIEILRFCSEINLSIVGGFGKLLSFLRNITDKHIITFSDKRLGGGEVYKKLGFKFIRETPPNFFYFHRNDPLLLYSRIKFQKHKLSSLLKNYDDNLSEWDNMINNGYDRIWDCGHKKWILP